MLLLTSVALIGTIVGKGMRYAIQLVIAWGLGAEAVGFFAFGLTVVSIGARFAQAGLDKAAEKYVSIHESEGNDRKLTGAILSTVLLSTVFGGTTVVALQVAVEFFDGPFEEYRSVIRLFAFAIPLLALMEIGMHATRGYKETKYSIYTREFVQSGLALVLVTISAFVFASLDLVIYSYILSLGVGLVLIAYYIYMLGGFEQIGNPEYQSRQILTFALPLLFAGVTTYAASWVDILFLGAFVSPSEVGVYQIAFQTSLMITIVLNAANFIFPSLIAESYHGNRRGYLVDLYKSVSKWTAYLTVFAALFVVVFAGEILALFGPEFEVGVEALAILAVGQALVAVTGSGGNVLKMTNFERMELYNSIGMLVLNSVLNYALIRWYGISGAAIATAFSLATLNIVRLLEVEYVIGSTPYDTTYWKGVVALIPTGSLFLVVSYLYSGIVPMVTAAVLGFVLFVNILYALGLEERDRILLESVGERAD